MTHTLEQIARETDKANELAFLALGGRAHNQKNCRCDPDVGAVPCEYCAIHDALEKTERLLTALQTAAKQPEGADCVKRSEAYHTVLAALRLAKDYVESALGRDPTRTKYDDHTVVVAALEQAPLLAGQVAGGEDTKTLRFSVNYAGDRDAGLFPFNDVVTISCDSRDWGALEPEAIEIFTDALKEFYDGASITLLDAAAMRPEPEQGQGEGGT